MGRPGPRPFADPAHAFADVPHDEVALAGKDGAQAAQLLGRSKDAGARTLYYLARRAVERLLDSPAPHAAPHLFDADEVMALADQLAATNATADLLGRARVRERARQAELVRDGTLSYADAESFAAFAEPPPPLPPAAAVDYFRSLVPSLAVSPALFGPAKRRQAFTLALSTDATMLDAVKRAIGDRLGSGDAGGPQAIDDILAAAGVHPDNPQYGEMVFRTNMMDAYNRGSAAELQSDDMKEVFPVWQYLGIRDGRQGKDHEPHFDKYYPNSRTFEEVRGPRVFNCRCSFRAVDRYEWADLQGTGAALHGAAARPPVAGPTAPPAPPAPLAVPPDVRTPPEWKRRPPPRPGAKPNPDLPAEARPVLSNPEKNAVRDYTALRYYEINQAAREGTPLTDPVAAATDAHLRVAFAKAEPFPAPVTVRRGVSLTEPDAIAFAARMRAARAAGETVTLPGYQSTSTDPAQAFHGTLRLEIEAIQGLDAKPYAARPREAELLLSRDARYLVVSAEHRAGVSYVKLRQSPGADAGESSITPMPAAPAGKAKRTPEPEPDAVPALAPKGPPATGQPGKPAVRAEVRERVWSAAMSHAGQVSEMAAVMDEHAQAARGVALAHGMAAPEPTRAMTLDGVHVAWHDTPDGKARAADALTRILVGPRPVPDRLWAANERVVFTSQQNKSDPLWAERYGIPGFVSAATGGDGGVVVYNTAEAPTAGTLAHESGHNLAFRAWGKTAPPPNSPFGRANKKEGPVSEYGAKSPAEDFAEACRMYAEDPDQLKRVAPAKYAAVHDMITGGK